jgi:hypothetical protein
MVLQADRLQGTRTKARSESDTTLPSFALQRFGGLPRYADINAYRHHYLR